MSAEYCYYNNHFILYNMFYLLLYTSPDIRLDTLSTNIFEEKQNKQVSSTVD